MVTSFVFVIAIAAVASLAIENENENESIETTELPEPIHESNIFYISQLDMQLDDQEGRTSGKNISAIDTVAPTRIKNRKKNSTVREAVRIASLQGFNAMIDLYERKEPEILRKGEYLDVNHPATQLSLFSAPLTNESDAEVRGAYASLYAAKKLQESLNLDFTGHGRQAAKKKISLKRTSLESLCPPRESPQCLPATRRYRTHDGTCNNFRRTRWGQAQMPFHRFLAPDYSDGLEAVRRSSTGDSLPSPRFVSLVVHGFREDEAPITMLLPQWGQLIDHDVTATLQPRSINGSIPSCCRSQEPHPSCLPITVPRDDPFLGTLGVRCLEFLRSAPAQRRDCFLSWREQTNQATSYIDASPVYSSNPRTADGSRIQRDGLLLFGRGPPREDACLRGGFGHQCIRAGDTRAGEQPGLLAMHTAFVAEHNRITLELADLNPHWSDEKLYQETRRIIGAIFQHITYREFLPLVLGREVCRLFELELESSGFSNSYDPKVNPTIANAFSAAAFRFGHALVQGSIMRSDASYRFLSNNVSLHEESSFGDIGGIGSLHRIIRGMATQRTLKRDEFMSPELTNHLFQSSSFPFGMDLAAINIQRGRDHGLPAYVDWRQPCGLSAIKSWSDLEIIAGPKSAERMRKAYGSVEDIDLFVGGISERPVVGGLVGPTFACIIAQQFSNLRRGDRFWYENAGFESSFTPSQLFSIRQVTLSQVLCRSLGATNFIQPHAFLPPEFSGNERQRCGSGMFAPMDLKPWIERDPFHKEGDFANLNFVEPEQPIFVTVRPINNEASPVSSQSPIQILNPAFETPVLITARPQLTTPDNKIDFPATTTKPKKKRPTTTTRRPSSTVIDNKIDFEFETSTTRPGSPFSKLGKGAQTSKATTIKEKRSTKVKRSTNVKRSTKTRKRPKDSIEPRSDDDLTDDSMTKTLFANGDNATRYLNNRPIKARLDDELESKETRYSYNNDFEFGDTPYRPTYDYNSRPYYPTYPPLNQPQLTSKRPVSYQNNRPSYQGNHYADTQQQPTRQTNSPISTKYSTPFSFDTYQNMPSANSPQMTYDNMVIPLYVSPNRYSNRPTFNRPTTRKMDLSTFLFVEYEKRTTTPAFNDFKRTTKRPFLNSYYQLPVSSSSSSSVYANNKFPTIGDTSFDDTDYDFSKPSYSINSKPHFTLNKNPSPLNLSQQPFSADPKPQSVFSHDAGDADEFDGYLRPETSFYIPLKTRPKPSYNDYSNYNQKVPTTKTNTAKYYYINNILHRYFAGKTDEKDEGLYDQQPTNRYAESYDEHLRLDDKTRTLTIKNDDVDLTQTETIDGRSRKGTQNIFLVPFQLLTKVERPDNWVNNDIPDIKLKTRLPEVPALMQDDSDVAKELPKPIFFRRRH